MIYKGNKPIDTMYVGGKLVKQVYKGSKKVYPEHGVIPKAIKDSMVLWYDLKRQGATNEDMSADPTLRDLSGNGHDATCYNFAWSGMSGIGGYLYDFMNWNFNDGLFVMERTSTSVHTDGRNEGVTTATFLEKYLKSGENTGTFTFPSFKIRVQNPNGFPICQDYYHNGSSADVFDLSESGTYTIPERTYEVDESMSNKKIALRFRIDDTKADAGTDYSNMNVTIELFPEYPHALVSDGVDDYAKVEGLPLLTKERGYTVVAKRKLLSYPFNRLQSLVSKRDDAYNGAFTIESYNDGSETGNVLYNFGQLNKGIVINNEELITVQTSTYYNGQEISIGNRPDTDFMIVFAELINSENRVVAFSQISLYSLLLFDRDLTVDEINWVKTNLIEGNDDDAEWYGVEFYTTSPNPDCIRIGNPELHKTLPVHNQMKGVLLADDGTENKLLNESDWTGETLDGSQGQVMVEMPKQSYWRFETDGNIRRVKFSTKPLPGFKPTPQGYVSSYEAVLQRSTNRLSSVVNTDADYRGGNNNASWDGTYRSLLGMPATSINRTNFRNYARNRKADSTEWNMMTYDMQKLLYWLFVVEYATLNTQKEFNPDKDSNGYAQGGLGNGVTNLSQGRWDSFNGYKPFIQCGYTNSLGNGTGQIAYTMPFEYDANGGANYVGEYSADTTYTDGQFVSQDEDLYECIADAAAGTELTNTTYFTKVTRTVTYVPRYRGIENPFGHLWQWTDGINVRISPTSDNGGDNLSKVYVCSDPAQFKDNGYDGYTYVGDEARNSQYVKEVIFGEGGEIIPKVVGDGASTTKYFCDYHHTNIPTTETLRGVQFGGNAHYGANVGFSFSSSNDVPAFTTANFGSRLCFIPNNND